MTMLRDGKQAFDGIAIPFAQSLAMSTTYRAVTLSATLWCYASVPSATRPATSLTPVNDREGHLQDINDFAALVPEDCNDEDRYWVGGNAGYPGSC